MFKPEITPYPYQLEGIEKGLIFKKFINGDDMGLGKTLQSIFTIDKANAFPCLIICPSALKTNWLREWLKLTDKKPVILNNSNKESWHYLYKTNINQVFITNYESLKKFFVLDIKKKDWKLKDVIFDKRIDLFKSVIIDESHRIKSPQAAQTKLCRGITKGKEYILLLSGTPIINKPKDLLTQLAIIDKINIFGGVQSFNYRYGKDSFNSNLANEMQMKLKESCFFARSKKDVLKELPDKIINVKYCDISNRDEYVKAEYDLIKYLKDIGEISKASAAQRAKALIKLHTLRDIVATGKIEYIKHTTKSLLDAGRKAAIFCNTHKVINELKETFKNAVSITGKESESQKQYAIDKIQNKKTNIATCSTRAAGVGITLTEIDDIIFAELPWTYSDLTQAEDRSYRIGRVNNTLCHHVIASDTVDEYVYSIINRKKNMFTECTGIKDSAQIEVLNLIAKTI